MSATDGTKCDEMAVVAICLLKMATSHIYFKKRDLLCGLIF